MSGNAQSRAALDSMEQKGLRFFGDVVDELSKDRRFNCLRDAANDQDNVNLNGIASNRDKYKSIDEYLLDIDALVQTYAEGSEMYEAALELKEDCHEYADAIKTCTDCYESRLSYEIQPNFFESVCTKPHLLVLAKCDGFPLWPAKLMRYNNDNRIATIQCFGDHQEADVPFDKCFLYSNAFRRTKDKKHITNLEKGYKEVERHIENIERKFGSFVPAPTKIAISDVEQHLIDMFPNVYGAKETATVDEHQPGTSRSASDGARTDNRGGSSGSGSSGSGNNNKRKLLEELGEISVKIAAHEKEIQNLKDQERRIQARVLAN